MECHRCPHREDLESGKFRGVAFEETPCASCELVEKPAFTIAFDEERPGGTEVIDARVEGEPARDEVRLPISVMSEAVVELLTMPRALRDIVCWRFAGVKYREIAQVFGVTTKAVERRQERAMEKWPALRALFAEKAAKQLRRKPHGRRK